MRKNEQPYSLLLRPTAQIALFRGLTLAIKSDRLSLTEALQRANKIDWRMTSPIWTNVLVRPRPLAHQELFYRFEFPERPGALMKFVDSMSPNWNRGMSRVRLLYLDLRETLKRSPLAIVSRSLSHRDKVGCRG